MQTSHGSSLATKIYCPVSGNCKDSVQNFWFFLTSETNLPPVLKNLARSINRFFIWPPWQVIIPIVLAIATAVGTIIEARYDMVASQKLVYKTWWMYLILGMMSATLIAVMIDRWPWKKRHIPFLLAHIGILILLLGSVLTYLYGLDGTMRFGIGEKSRFVSLPDTEISVWSSFDGERYSKMLGQDVDFFLDDPAKKPIGIELPEGKLQIMEYRPYVLASRQIAQSQDARSGAAVRFQLKNAMVNVNEWLFQTRKDAPAQQMFGPATVTLGFIPKEGMGKNELYIKTKNANEMEYALFYQDSSKKPKKGILKQGDVVDTGWMGLELQILRYFERAEEKWDFKTLDRPTELSTAAIRLMFGEKEYWVQLNDVIKLFTENAVYIFTYGTKRIDIGFDLLLKKFEIGRYQGTMRAASYQSLVEVPGHGETLISMNNPLKHNGLTFYQASFQEGPDGQPTASILSVNKDPGRWLKYLGSLILSLGVVWLFYDKRRASRSRAPKEGAL